MLVLTHCVASLLFRKGSMPRQNTRQRIVYCDCFDCLDRPTPTVASDEALAASEAVAQQKPPPKALVLYGSGLLRSATGSPNVEQCTLPHLDKVTKEGALGLLAVRSSTASGPAAAGISELAQFLGVHDELAALSPEQQSTNLSAAKLPSLSSRFQGMASQFASTSQAACALASAQQMEVNAALSIRPSTAAIQPSRQWPGAAVGLPDPAAYCTALVNQLQPEEGSSGTDLVLVHIDLQDLAAHMHALPVPAESSPQGDTSSGLAEGTAGKVTEDGSADASDASYEGLEWLDALVKHLMQVQAVKERVLLSVVVSAQGHPLWSEHEAHTAASGQTGSAASGPVPGGLPLQQQLAMQPGGAPIDPAAFVVTPRSAHMAASIMSGGAAIMGLDLLDEGDCPQVLRPLQSFQFLGLKQVDAALAAPALVVRRLPGVVRRDRAERLTLTDANTKGGQGTILIDRLIPEIAYKLGRAPKYGA